MYQNITDVLLEQGIRPEVIRHLLTQGIEVEMMRLEVSRCLDAESISIRLNIIEGERFVDAMHSFRQ